MEGNNIDAMGKFFTDKNAESEHRKSQAFTRQDLTDIEFLVNMRIMQLGHERAHVQRVSVKHYKELLEKVRKM